MPETVQNLMHFETNKDRLGKIGDEEFYRNNGISFEKHADGTYEIFGIGYKNAMTMCSIFQRRPAKTAKKAEFAQWEQHVIDVQDFFLRPNIMEAAQRMSSSSFEDFLRKQATVAGIIEATQVEEAVQPKAEKVKAKQDSKPSIEEQPVELPVKLSDVGESFLDEQSEGIVSANAVAAEEIVKVQDATPAKQDEVVKQAAPTKVEKPVAHNLSPNSYASMLAAGKIQLSIDWAEKLSDKVAVGDAFAERVMKWMILNDILVEA